MVAIIDYGMGNVESVQKALNFLNIASIVTREFGEINKADVIILPGVGSFRQGMVNLHKFGLVDLLTYEVKEKRKPFIGICLGMQLIANHGTEPIDTPGLGWIDGQVIKIEAVDKRIPHLGWNTIKIHNSTYYKGLTSFDFYFIHSYHFDVSDKQYIAATVNYGIELVASVQLDNIFATQFHPEKSQQAGLQVLKNFFAINAKN
jgi:imidazole glycerol-phosphate synthase subunit HisH